MSPGYQERREQLEREQRSFDRMFRIAFPIAFVLGILSTVAMIVLYLAGSAWLVGVTP